MSIINKFLTMRCFTNLQGRNIFRAFQNMSNMRFYFKLLFSLNRPPSDCIHHFTIDFVSCYRGRLTKILRPSKVELCFPLSLVLHIINFGPLMVHNAHTLYTILRICRNMVKNTVYKCIPHCWSPRILWSLPWDHGSRAWNAQCMCTLWGT